MQAKRQKLFQAIKRFTEESRHDKSISIIPYGLIGYKNIIIQKEPFLEIKQSSNFLHGLPFQGAQFILLYPETKLEVIKPLLGVLVMLLENEIPLIVMPFKGVDWIFLPILQEDFVNYATDNPSIFLERFKEVKQLESHPMPDFALSNCHSYAIDYINNKKPPMARIPISMHHEKYSLQGE